MKQVSREVFLHGNSDIQSALRKRLLAKGFNPTPKNKGELHIFVAFALSNWESGLPIALEAFGRVTVFEWRSMAFDERSNDWPKIRDAKNAEVVKAFQNAHS